jgi:hypothetical protein
MTKDQAVRTALAKSLQEEILKRFRHGGLIDDITAQIILEWMPRHLILLISLKEDPHAPKGIWDELPLTGDPSKLEVRAIYRLKPLAEVVRTPRVTTLDGAGDSWLDGFLLQNLAGRDYQSLIDEIWPEDVEAAG